MFDIFTKSDIFITSFIWIQLHKYSSYTAVSEKERETIIETVSLFYRCVWDYDICVLISLYIYT